MGVRDDAKALHDSGFNCAQSVLGACGKYTGLDKNTALAISAGFGGGVRCGEICGAISGCVMAVGMANPFTDGKNSEAKTRIAELTKLCTGAFREKFGCVRCVELKEAGISCDEIIQYGAEIAEQVIADNK